MTAHRGSVATELGVGVGGGLVGTFGISGIKNSCLMHSRVKFSIWKWKEKKRKSIFFVFIIIFYLRIRGEISCLHLYNTDKQKNIKGVLPTHLYDVPFVHAEKSNKHSSQSFRQFGISNQKMIFQRFCLLPIAALKLAALSTVLCVWWYTRRTFYW